MSFFALVLLTQQSGDQTMNIDNAINLLAVAILCNTAMTDPQRFETESDGFQTRQEAQDSLDNQVYEAKTQRGDGDASFPESYEIEDALDTVFTLKNRRPPASRSCLVAETYRFALPGFMHPVPDTPTAELPF